MALLKLTEAFLAHICVWLRIGFFLRKHSVYSNKNQNKPTVEKFKGLEPLWSAIFDATPLYVGTKVSGSFANVVRVELKRQATKVATEKAEALRRQRLRSKTKGT